MITITRRLAGQLRVIFKKALMANRGPGPVLHFATGRDGIHVRAKSADAAVEYHAPQDNLPPEGMCVPFEMLADVEARRDDPVQIEMLGDGRVVAGWRDGNVPQMTQYEPVKPVNKEMFPKMPSKFAENQPKLLRALHECMETTDPNTARYALSCTQLRGKSGEIVATDGRQILLGRGFEFPWDEDLLLPRSNVFGSKELTDDQPVSIGRTEDWITVRVGPWTFHRTIEKDKRYPQTDSHVPNASNATATLRISPKDVPFLAGTLPKLPGTEEFNLPITVDLNGAVAIRAKSACQPKPTEAILSNSTWSGEAMRLAMNRTFLSRALKMGFDEVHLFKPNTPVLCQDDRRSYIWALLEGHAIIKPSKGAIRISPPAASQYVPTINRKPRKRKTTMVQSTDNGNGKPKPNGQTPTATTEKTDEPAVDTLIEQAETLKTSLRDSLGKTNELVSALKLHKKRSKAVQSALVSLRKLQAVEA